MSISGESPELQWGETEAQSKGWSHSYPVCGGSKGRAAGSALEGLLQHCCFRLMGAVGLQPPLPAPTPVGRERCQASFHDLFRVTERRVLVTAIREQHRYGALPGHQCAPSTAWPPRSTRAPTMGCPGTEAPSSLHLLLFPVCPAPQLGWAVTPFAWALAQSGRLLGSVCLHPCHKGGQVRAHRGFELPPWATTFPWEGGVRSPDGLV